ncbi:MAG: nitroreductase/quinone reductase family protein [Candidatus Promineifilaceae bacterium]|nr:nitroreductase/quinone reductase family protein [Candidatus Promineifilaceae bacterium]
MSQSSLLQKAVLTLAALAPITRLLSHLLPTLDRLLLRLSGGRHSFTGLISGLPTGTLTTTGARSGLPRSVPIIPTPVGDKWILIASNFGRAHHPAWYHNLKTRPEATLTLDGRSHRYRAREATGEERERYWARAVDAYPGYAAYARRAAKREIPVLVLELADSNGTGGATES